MNRAPVRWDNGRWDIGSKGNMGVDSIPTLYDANVSGYIPTEYRSGIGYDNDLYMRGLQQEVDTVDPYPLGVKPSGNVWLPEVEGGYFYIGQDQYYLFANKVTVVGIPAASGDNPGRLELGLHNDKYPVQGAPVIVTLGASEFNAGESYGRTYEATPSGIPTRTATKYRGRTDLGDRKEFQIDASGNVVPYSFNLGDMEYTIGSSGNHPTGWHWYIDTLPSGSSVTVEMEGGPSGYARTQDVDLNPLNTYEAQNVFLVTTVGTVGPYILALDNVSRYIPTASQRVGLLGAIKDEYGSPVSGVTVSFSAIPGAGTFSPGDGATIWDGTFLTNYTLPASYSATGVTITMTIGTMTEKLWIPMGKVI